MTEPLNLTRDDFVSDQEVRWCPGCGDYAVLASIQRLMPTLNIPKENHVFISGIGCSSRFPYYMKTYGFHSIHGRAMTLATGLKVSRPELTVWVVTGDGDALSIGGNHFIHCLRRNVGLNILLFNNRIYGLTKGQYSPTSEKGKKTKSSPYGSIDYPINALSLALAAEATFIARTIDVHTQHLTETVRRAAGHEGVSFVEIYQNCNIFNDGAFKNLTEREFRDDRLLALEHGKPMLFGADRKKGIRLKDNRPEIVTIGENGVTEADILVHDEHAENPTIAYMLTRMDYPNYPVPIGVVRSVQKPTYEEMLHGQIAEVKTMKGKGDLGKLLRGSETWEVK
ncbi:MAG TPA: 2-oxoacid:ferredoxin oxidoreductase subunit beta [Bdellovibrionota bacterium]|nr:2-oxoacid:ferredoxin oxidoreductase subunit beta [Bdellovibrionota bacterium]